MLGDYARCQLQCNLDSDCPLLYYCCPNGCGRLCVPAQVNAADDCGCSVTFLMTAFVSDTYIRLNNLLWESLNESFTPSIEPYIAIGLLSKYAEYYSETYLGPMANLCSLKRQIVFGPDSTSYNAFKKPNRILVLFLDVKYQDIYNTSLDNGALSDVYNTVCAVNIGNISIGVNLLNQLTIMDDGEPCLWNIDSTKSLKDLAPNVTSIINDGNCNCGNNATLYRTCIAEGEACDNDTQCDQSTHICNKGVCSPVSCIQPDTYDPEPVDYYSKYSFQHYAIEDYNYGITFNYFYDDGVGFHSDYDYFYYDFTPPQRSGGRLGKTKQGVGSKHDKQKHREEETRSSFDSRPYSYLSFRRLGCCTWYEFQCSGVPAVCISDVSVCNGIPDCINGDDETPEACAKRSCSDGWFKCTSGQCISHQLVCNGDEDCPDGSDEYCLKQSDCPSNRQHLCSTGECIKFYAICDQSQDCKSGEDEIHCRCRGFRCKNSVSLTEFFLSGSDAACPKDRPFKCDEGRCIYDSQLCDSWKNCEDGSDEALIMCYPEYCFYCDSGQCIHKKLVCDGIDDCEDRSDETRCIDFACGADQFHCSSGECLIKSVMCNGREECVDGSDESICSTVCPDDRPLRCSTGECIDFSMVCDAVYHCTDQSDESKCLNMSCPSDRRHQCLSGECRADIFLKCKGVPNCHDATDEANCTLPDCSNFRCKSGKCAYACDGYRDCEDGADEENCEGKPCPSYYDNFRCNSGECINHRLRCNSRINCQDGSDEIDCQGYNCSMTGLITCASGECVDGWKCDNKADCKDGTDEVDCEEKCSDNRKKCKSGKCIFNFEYCDGYRQCFDSSDENQCLNLGCPADRPFQCKSGACRKANHRCDGFTSCADGSDEEDCLNYTCPSYQSHSCPSGICISVYQLCNGVDDCGDGSDETDCEILTCPKNSFKCNRGNCLPPIYRCDGEPDCADGEDEADCKNYVIQCGHMFPCVPDNICMPLYQVCDGHNDCGDKFDEKNCKQKP